MVLARLGQGQMNFVGWALALSMPEIQFQYMYDVIRTQNDSFSPKIHAFKGQFFNGSTFQTGFLSRHDHFALITDCTKYCKAHSVPYPNWNSNPNSNCSNSRSSNSKYLILLPLPLPLPLLPPHSNSNSNSTPLPHT